jgi:hypothetical protein
MGEPAKAGVEEEGEEPRYRAAFQQLAEERAALRRDEVQKVNADVMLTVTIVLGAWPNVRALRERIAYELPRFDLERFDRFEQYVRAFSHAYTACAATGIQEDAFRKPCHAASTTFNQLFADAATLAGRGFISDEPLGRLKRGNGYRRLPRNLLAVVYLLRTNWSALAGKTAATLTELDAAERLGEALLRAIADRGRTPATVVASRDDLERAFTLFVRLYQETRAAVIYVRRKEGDGERILPTIYGGRAKGRKRATREATEKPSAADPTSVTTAVDAAVALGTPASAARPA